MIEEKKNGYRVLIMTEKERMKNWKVICLTPFGVKGIGFEKLEEQEKT